MKKGDKELFFIKDFSGNLFEIKGEGIYAKPHLGGQFELEIICDFPVIVKVLTSLTLILILNRVLRQLIVSVAVGTLVLAVWCGHCPAAIWGIAWGRFASLNNLMLMLVVLQVIWLSSQMSAAGVMKDLVVATRRCISQRGAMAILPAVIGVLPMPGGALFSAPLVDDCDHDKSIQPLLKTQVNYWFRHVWEYWWPLYPGVLLAIEITGLEIWQFILLQFPLSLLSVMTGYWFLLRRIPPQSETRESPKPKLDAQFISMIMPILVVIVCYAGIRLLLPWITMANKYLPMILGLLAAIMVLQAQRPLNCQKWKTILLSRKTLVLALVVAMVRIYGAFIEAPLPNGIPLVGQMRQELSTLGIPVWAVIMTVPFISGMVTGIAIGFVGASFPIVVSLLGENPELGVLLPATVLAYGFGYMGMILSPVHVCLVVTNEHFRTRLIHSLAALLKPVAAMLAGIAIYYFFVAWLF